MSPRIDRRSFLLAGAGAVLLAACTDSASSTEDTLGGIDALDDIATAPTGDDGPQRIVMVGDSITFMSADELRAGFEHLGLDVVAIDAQVGRRMTVSADGLYAGTDVIRFIAAGDSPDVWVVALGANDVGQYADAAGYTEQVLAVLAEIPQDAPLVWVNAWHRDRLEACELLNGVLRTVVGARPRSLVVDWFAHGDDEGVISGDGVHPTTQGEAVFGLVVTDGVSRLLTSA